MAAREVNATKAPRVRGWLGAHDDVRRAAAAVFLLAAPALGAGRKLAGRVREVLELADSLVLDLLSLAGPDGKLKDPLLALADAFDWRNRKTAGDRRDELRDALRFLGRALPKDGRRLREVMGELQLELQDGELEAEGPEVRAHGEALAARSVVVWVPLIVYLRADGGGLGWETHGAFSTMVDTEEKRRRCEGDFWSCFEADMQVPGSPPPLQNQPAPGIKASLCWVRLRVPVSRGVPWAGGCVQAHVERPAP